MFWGVKICGQQNITLNDEVTITNICGMGEVRLNNILIGTLTQDAPQIQMYIKVKGKISLQGNADIVGYIENPDFSTKAQNLQSQEELDTIYKAQLRNICKMLYK